MLLLHVFQMSFALGLTSRTSWSLPLKLWLNCPVVRQHVESGLLASSDCTCGRCVTPKRSRHQRMPTLDFSHCLPLGPRHRLRHGQGL